MMVFRLQVFSALSEEYFRPALAQEDFPEEVDGTLAQYDEGTFAVAEGGAALLLTDRAELALSLCRAKNERLHIVYLGEPADVADAENAPDDVWHPSEGGALLKRRYLRLLRALKDEYDLWFYKNALLTTIDTVPDMLWYKRIDGIHALVNDAFAKIVKKDKDDVIGKDHFYIWNVPRPADGNAAFACAESEEIAISTGKTYACAEPVKTSAGMKQLDTFKTPLYDMFGNVFGTVGVGHDVTNINNMGVQLSILMESLPFPMCIFDVDWKVVRMNSAFSVLAGLSEDESERAAFDYAAWKEDVFLPVGGAAESSVRRSASHEYQVRLGLLVRRFIVTELEICNYFGDVTGYFSTMEDVTYRRAYEQTILEAANTDMLTGLYNRRYFNNFVRGNTGHPFHLLYMDLDRFKEINDTHGHKAGDEVLIKVSELIQEFFPRTVIARLGGDEFVVADEEHDRAYLERRCGEFEDAVSAALVQYGQGSSVSIGIAYTDGSPGDIDRVLDESDSQMYEIKKRHHEKA